MRWFTPVFLAILAVALALDGKDEGKEKKDLALAETRVPFSPYGGYGPIDHSLGLGVDPAYGAGYGIGVGHLGHGGLANPALIARPYGLGEDIAYSGGYLKGGLHQGGLGIHGSDFFRGGSDGRFADGLYHQGGRLSNGGYYGSDGYRDDKHHIADDHANKAYFSDVQGSRKDLGNGQLFDKSQGAAQNGYNTFGDNELAGHKKGHHKTGFRKSYHKDESGNDESFYDSDHDEGNHEIGKLHGDTYGSNFASKVNGGHNINEFNANNVGREGFEGAGKVVALNQGLKDYYGQNGVYNSGNKFGSLGHGQSSDFGNYGVNRGFHDGYHNGRDFGYDKFGRNSFY